MKLGKEVDFIFNIVWHLPLLYGYILFRFIDLRGKLLFTEKSKYFSVSSPFDLYKNNILKLLHHKSVQFAIYSSVKLCLQRERTIENDESVHEKWEGVAENVTVCEEGELFKGMKLLATRVN